MDCKSPASYAFVRYIHENHTKNGQWPVNGEEQDTQFLHAVYLPNDISDKWEAPPPMCALADAAPDTDFGSDGGKPIHRHAPGDAAPEAVEHDTKVGTTWQWRLRNVLWS